MGTARARLEAALAALEEREPSVRAWAFVDADGAGGEADAVDRAGGGVMGGAVLGVKDLFDTATMPTELGTPIHAGRRPAADAHAVAALRRGGAVLLGKTVTAELGGYHPGPTTNPLDQARTPGGSSMGSAAAVAAGMADVALGAQTAASVIRPASFCGVVGFKPTFGAVSTAGLRVMSPSFDTVGWFARDVGTVERARRCLLGPGGDGPERGAARPGPGGPAIGVLRTDRWDEASADSRRAVEELAALARRHGATVVDLPMPEAWRAMDGVHTTIMEVEASRTLAWEYARHRAELSRSLAGLVERGRVTPHHAYEAALGAAAVARAAAQDVFARTAALLTPAVLGEAPLGHGSTGDPRFGRLWSLLGLPVLCLPGALGCSGMPVGVQIVGMAGADAEVTAIGAWLEAASAGTGDGGHSAATRSISTRAPGTANPATTTVVRLGSRSGKASPKTAS